MITFINMCCALSFLLAAVSAHAQRSPLKVEMVSPVNGQIVQGAITIQAAVNHPDEVNFLDFYIQEPGAKDRYGWKSYSPPYFWGGEGQKLDTTLFADGPASAVVFCSPKNSHLSIKESRVRFIIDNGKPKVKILSPKDSETVRGNMAIRLEASDPKGIHKQPGVVAVYVYVDGSLLQKFTRTPYQTVLRSCLLAPGVHSIRTVAEDTEGLISVDQVMVSVAPGASAVRAKMQ